MTKTAKRFLDAVSISWDTPQPWQDTAKLGLSYYDLGVLRGWARKAHEPIRTVKSEIMEAVKSKVNL